MNKATREQYKAIRDRVALGIWYTAHSEDGNAAYAEAEALFSPRQMQALHRTMRDEEEEAEQAELRRFVYGDVCQ